MADPGTPLAVISAIDLAVKYGRKLVEKYRAYKTAEGAVSGLLFRAENQWLRFDCQTRILARTWDSLAEDQQLHMHSLLITLDSKIRELNGLLDAVIGISLNDRVTTLSLVRKKGVIRAAKFAWSFQEHLRRAVDDIEQWHGIFDSTWYLISRVSDTGIDKQLDDNKDTDEPAVVVLKSLRDALHTSEQDSITSSGQTIVVPPETIADNGSEIKYSKLRVYQLQGRKEEVVVDTIVLDPHNQVQTTSKEALKLARVLSRSDPLVFGLLKCYGVIEEDHTSGAGVDAPTSLKLLFSIPPGLRIPKSLRELLLTEEHHYSLTERLNLARLLASSVLYIHSSKFVHKNIRPETTVVFRDDESHLAAPFLMGFEKFRTAEGPTQRQGDAKWERNLYRHPTRQGLHPEEDYVMQHDIYSLGVMLLEVGLWVSFALPDPAAAAAAAAGTFKPASILGVEEIIEEHNDRKRALHMKAALIKLAEMRLASKMGDKYSDTVLACLTCLDREGDNLFGHESEFVDKDEIVVGIRYIEKVLLQLHDISV